MKAVVLKRYGTPDVLELRDVAKPTPKSHEVLVRIHAASVNDWDWGLLQGAPFVIRLLHGLVTPKVQIIGGDIAGRVEAVGGDVRAFQPGDEVYGDLCMSGFGAFAEYACAPEAGLARKPARMTFEQAAAIPQAGGRGRTSSPMCLTRFGSLAQAIIRARSSSPWRERRDDGRHTEIVTLGEWAALRTSFRWRVVSRAEGDALVRLGNTVRFYRRDDEGTRRPAREVWNTSPPPGA